MAGILSPGAMASRAMASNLRAMASNLRAMASNLRAMASNLRAMASNLRAMASYLRAMASNLRAMASYLRAMASNLRAMASYQPILRRNTPLCCLQACERPPTAEQTQPRGFQNPFGNTWNQAQPAGVPLAALQKPSAHLVQCLGASAQGEFLFASFSVRKEEGQFFRALGRFQPSSQNKSIVRPIPRHSSIPQHGSFHHT